MPSGPQKTTKLLEYDFRLESVDQVSAPKKAKQISEYLLKVVDGFTTIPPNVFTDLVPGKGTGYILGLKDKAQLFNLQTGLEKLTQSINCSCPKIIEASTGNRKNYCFLLIPLLVNKGESDYRRPLFSTARWEMIHHVMKNEFPNLYFAHVYGEWWDKDFSKQPISDTSRMFVFPPQTGADEEKLTNFIREQLFNEECDQECFYLSVGGIGNLVFAK